MTEKYSDLMSITYWDEVRSEVNIINPSLGNAIDSMSPDKTYQILRVRYPYGCLIYDKGRLCLPDRDGRFSSLDDGRNFHTKLSKLLNYAATPLMLQLNNSSEVYHQEGDSIYPYDVNQPGDLYGLEAILDLLSGTQSFDYKRSVSSGARSAFLLQSLMDEKSFNRVKNKYHLSIDKPKSAFDHWDIFKNIAKNRAQPWFSEVLVFTNKWFDHIDLNTTMQRNKSLAWHPFYLALRNNAMSKYMPKQFNLGENINAYQMLHKMLQIKSKENNLVYNFFYKDVVEHLLKLAVGEDVGYTPCDDSQSLLPTDIIEKAILDCYQTRDAPIIFCPGRLKDNNKAVYFSFSHPTFITAPSTISREIRSLVQDLKNTKSMIDILKATINDEFSELLNINDIFFKKNEYEFFYREDAGEEDIKLSTTIPDSDPVLNRDMQSKWNNLKFPHNGRFVRACVKVTKT